MGIGSDFNGGNKVERSFEYQQIMDQHKGFESTIIKDMNYARNFQNKVDANISKNNKISKTNLIKPLPTNLSKNINNTHAGGTDIADIKRIAKQVTDQFYSFLWNQMVDKTNQNPLGGFGEAMFRDRLQEELYKASAGTDLDELATAIFNDLMRQYGFVEQNDIKPK